MIFWVGAVDDGPVAGGARRGRTRSPPAQASPRLWHGTRWWLVPYVVVLLALYAWLLPTLGFLAGTVLLLFILFMTIDRQGWIAPPLRRVLATAAAYIVFHRWLGTQLPAGEVEALADDAPAVIFGRS